MSSLCVLGGVGPLRRGSVLGGATGRGGDHPQLGERDPADAAVHADWRTDPDRHQHRHRHPRLREYSPSGGQETNHCTCSRLTLWAVAQWYICLVVLFGFTCALTVCQPRTAAFTLRDGVDNNSIGVAYPLLTMFSSMVGAFELDEYTNAQSTVLLVLFLLFIGVGLILTMIPNLGRLIIVIHIRPVQV